MYGAVLGDLAGSIYEYDQVKRVHPVSMEELIPKDAFFTDDTILTMAIADCILNGGRYEDSLKKYIDAYKDYHPDFSPTFASPFSPGLIKWARGEVDGKSKGNGAMMRISPVGELIHGEREIILQSTLATSPSHNSPEALWSATTIALMIYYLRAGYSKKDVFRKLELPIHYEPFEKFNTTCLETIDNCLWAFYYSKSLEDAIERTLWMGGDTDTNCSIVGALSEAHYGIDEDLKRKVEEKVPKEFVKVLRKEKNLS